MTADVIHIRREIASIAARRPDSIRPDAVLSLADSMARHPAVVSKRRQLERQQLLLSLLTAVHDGRLSTTDDRDLPLIVGVLLHACPQARTEPLTVAAYIARAVGGDVDDLPWLAGRLAAGTAAAGTFRQGPSPLADWLETAGGR